MASRGLPKGFVFWSWTSCTRIAGDRGAMSPFWLDVSGEALDADQLQCVGTSATLAGSGTLDEQRAAGGSGCHPSLRSRGTPGERHQ